MLHEAIGSTMYIESAMLFILKSSHPYFGSLCNGGHIDQGNWEVYMGQILDALWQHPTCGPRKQRLLSNNLQH